MTVENEYRLVPVEPTEDMLRAIRDHADTHPEIAFQAMLAATPAPPAGGDVEVQRWHPQKTPIGTIMRPHVEGDFVTLEDHCAHVTRLQAEVEQQLKLKMILAERVTNAEDNCSVYRAERDALKAEVGRLKNLPHGQILAESAARHLLDSGAANFVGDVLSIDVDDGTTKFEIVVTTQKVGAKSPGEVCHELQSELTKARELLAEVIDGTGTSPGANKRYGKIRAYLASVPTCKTCKGTGKEYDGAAHTCTVCNGSGLAHQSAPATTCATCQGTKLVDDGEINHYPYGSPFSCGPVKCVKDCPDCVPAAKPDDPDKCEHSYANNLGCPECGEVFKAAPAAKDGAR